MAFQVRKASHRAWPVTVKLQDCHPNGDVYEVEQSFVGHFRAFTEAEYKAIVAEVEAIYPPQPEGTPIDFSQTLTRNAEFFARLIVGWGPEVADENGQTLLFSTDALKAMITGPDGMAISAGLAVAVGQLRFGAAPAKNSPTSPAHGASSAAGEAGTNLPTT